MYKIINVTTGDEIGMVEKPLYIKIKESTGVRVPLKVGESRDNAQGIAYKDSAYNLQGTEGVGADITVLLVEMDAGITASATAQAIEENSEAIDQLVIAMLGV